MLFVLWDGVWMGDEVMNCIDVFVLILCLVLTSCSFSPSLVSWLFLFAATAETTCLLSWLCHMRDVH